MIVISLKAATVASTLLMLIAGFVWWLEGYMARPIKTTIMNPWELIADEVDRLVDMPEHLVLYGSDDEFNAWLRRDLSGLPQPPDLGRSAGIF